MIPVSTQELDTVASLGNSLHLTLFGLCAGGFIAFSIVLTTANVSDPKTYAAYIAALIASGVFSIYFGIRGLLDYRAAKKRLKEIKRGE